MTLPRCLAIAELEEHFGLGLEKLDQTELSALAHGIDMLCDDSHSYIASDIAGIVADTHALNSISEQRICFALETLEPLYWELLGEIRCAIEASIEGALR